ncbi:hypothetical protein [Roseomonas populi]|uniref:Uncharacterized protein n=1 Tax=Roseomonas populi TaxID=3121582 RepID=A0ABT1XAF3_9PROT|nr:hypothetical protein [Roseomonas pecuniae]MCR0985073.1 hypothetical protein [Roseomonas pecuniae]
MAEITWRAAEPEALASRVDFTIDLRTGRLRTDPLDRIASLFIGLAQYQAARYVEHRPVHDLLTEGATPLQDGIAALLAADPWLREMGLSVVTVRIAGLSPSAELARALETPTFERALMAPSDWRHDGRPVVALILRYGAAAQSVIPLTLDGAEQPRQPEERLAAAMKWGSAPEGRTLIMAQQRLGAARLQPDCLGWNGNALVPRPEPPLWDVVASRQSRRPARLLEQPHSRQHLPRLLRRRRSVSRRQVSPLRIG